MNFLFKITFLGLVIVVILNFLIWIGAVDCKRIAPKVKVCGAIKCYEVFKSPLSFSLPVGLR